MAGYPQGVGLTLPGPSEAVVRNALVVRGGYWIGSDDAPGARDRPSGQGHRPRRPGGAVDSFKKVQVGG